jgi:hypothetical protein
LIKQSLERSKIDMKKANRAEPINLKLLMNRDKAAVNMPGGKISIKSKVVEKARHDALQNICKEKDKVINYYINLSTSLKKQLQTLKSQTGQNK